MFRLTPSLLLTFAGWTALGVAACAPRETRDGGESESRIAVAVEANEAQEVNVFGPTLATRQRGIPRAEIFTFQRPAGVVAPFHLAVAGSGLTNSVIKLNGQAVVGANDFRMTNVSLEREVTLADRNTLEVEVRGLPSSRLALRLSGVIDAEFDNSPAACAPGADGLNIQSQYLVLLPEDTADVDAAIADLKRSYDFDVINVYQILHKGFSARLASLSEWDGMSTDPRVVELVPDLLMPACAWAQVPPSNATAPNVALNFDMMRIGASHDGERQTLGEKGQGVGIAVIDSGISPHPDLKPLAGGVSCDSGDYDRDDDPHGTAVAGIIAAQDNGVGVFGVAPDANIYSVKVRGAHGVNGLDKVRCGLEWVAAHASQVSIANMSLSQRTDLEEANPGGTLALTLFREEVERVSNLGVTVVVSAGNHGDDTERWVPAKYDGSVITVSGYADADGLPGHAAGTFVCQGNVFDGPFIDDTIWADSNHGAGVDLAAPSVCITSLLPGGGTGHFGGTSAAAPFVSGSLALLEERMGRLAPFALEELLSRQEPGPLTGDPDPAPNKEGLLRIGAALEVRIEVDGVEEPDAGQIRSTDPERISCGRPNNSAAREEHCRASFLMLDDVELQAAPNSESGLEFDSWAGDCASSPAAASVSVLHVDGELSCTATFRCPDASTWEPATQRCRAPDIVRAYVPTGNSALLAVIDVAAKTKMAEIPVGSFPAGVALAPNGQRVYVANFLANSLSVIDTATNVVTQTVGVGSHPFGVAVSPDSSRVYVANRESGTVSVIDGSVGGVIATIAVGSCPGGMALSPDGSRAFLANPCGSTVTILDLTSNAVQSVQVQSVPTYVGVSPSGDLVYIGHQSSRATLSVIDALQNTLLSTQIFNNSGSAWLSVAPDGVVYLPTLGGLREIGGAGRIFPSGTGAVTPDGSTLLRVGLAPDEQGFPQSSVVIYDRPTGQALATLRLTVSGAGPVGSIAVGNVPE